MSDAVLEIRGLCKEYPSFRLKDVGFSLVRGHIMGFIGRNGAGKTTTLKSALNIVHPSAGELRYFGLDFAENELEIKRRIAFVSGGANYYPNKKLSTITAVTRSFYEGWDEAAYRRYLQFFALDESKTLKALSQRLSSLSDKRVLSDPGVYIDNRRLELDRMRERLSAAAERKNAAARRDFVRLGAALDAMSPLRVLTRGYSLAEDPGGALIKSAAQLRPGDRVRLRFAEGGADCTVDSVNKGD